MSRVKLVGETLDIPAICYFGASKRDVPPRRRRGRRLTPRIA
jgi:hypothetical protein